MHYQIDRCVLCGSYARRSCSYCGKPICARCRLVYKGQVYCTTEHRDRDAGIGRLMRKFSHPLRMV